MGALGENAVLLDVRGAGTPNDYGDTSSPAAPSWSGSVPCFLRRRRRLQHEGGLATLIEQDELIVRLIAGAPPVKPGDRGAASSVLVEDRRVLPAVTRRFRVAGATVRSGGGTIADSVLMELADGD